MTTLPPQAYTREMLSTAYSWLLTQPESIRNLAQTPDALVGLFLRAKKTGESSLESVAPVSREVFRQDLKHLAAELQQFEHTDRTHSERSQPERASDVTVRSTTHSHSHSAPVIAPTVSISVSPTHPQAPSPTYSATHTPSSVAATNARPAQRTDTFALDEKSREMIRDVMTRLNLSSESEALRALLTLGYDRIKGVLPPV